MASREQTLLFIVDVQVRGAEKLAALRGEMAALDGRSQRYEVLRQTAERAALTNESLARSFDQVNRSAAGPPPGSESTFLGARGRRDIGGRTNPEIVAIESGQAAGLGSLAADSPNAPRPPRRRPTSSTAADMASQAALSSLDKDAARIADAVAAEQQLQGALGGVPMQRLVNDLAQMQASRPRTLSAAETAGRMGISTPAARDLAAQGQIPGARKEAGQWVIPEQAVIDYMASSGGSGGGGGGRPPIAFGGPGGESGGGGFLGGGGVARTRWGPLAGLQTMAANANGAFSFKNLFFGNGGNGGAFGLPAMGSIGSLAGLGLEHWVMTGLGLAGSAAAGAAGGGLLAASSLSQMAAGGLPDMLANATTLSNVKSVYTAQNNLNTAIATYGKNSTQATQAQQQYNAAIGELPPKAAKAEIAVANAAAALKQYWRTASQPAQNQSSHLFMQALGFGHTMVPHFAAAANTNLQLVNQGLHPLFQWLEGPQGIGIFNTLENKFAKDLPTSIHAFDMAVEDFLRLMAAASKYTGGLSHWLDRIFTAKSKESAAQYSQEVQKLVADFDRWKNLLKILAIDLVDLFRMDQGTANSIVVSLTQMLDKLHQWETSTSGQSKMQTIFYVHKQQIDALLQLLPDFARAYGSFYMLAAPTLVRGLTAVASAVNAIARAVESIPGGSALLGLVFVLHRLGTLGPLLRGVGGALGLVAKGEGAAGGAGMLGLLGKGGAGNAVSTLETAGGAGAAGSMFTRGVLGRIGVSGVGSAISGGVESGALGLASAAEGAGLGGMAGGIAAAGGALAPFAAAVVPVAVAAIAAYGIDKLITGGPHYNANAHNLSNPQINHYANVLQQHGVGALGMATGTGIYGATGHVVPGTTGSTVGSLLSGSNVAQQLYHSYTMTMGNPSAVAKMGVSQLQSMLNEGRALRSLLSGNAADVSKLDQILGHTKQDLAPMESAIGLMMRRWEADGTKGLHMLTGVFDSNMKLIANTIGLHTSEGNKMMHQNVQQMVAALTHGMADGRITVQRGMAALNQMLNQGLRNGGESWRQKWDAMFSALSVAFQHHRIDARNYSNDVTQYLTTGADHVRQGVINRYQQMISHVKQLFAQGKDGMVVTQQQLNAQIAGLDAQRNKDESAALAVWLSHLQSTLSAAGQLTAAEAARINSALTSALNVVGPGTPGGNIGSGVGHRATGGMLVGKPMFMVGEQAPAHPEVVIATNPAYRQRNLGLWAQAGRALGVQGFAAGGVTGAITQGAAQGGGMVLRSIAGNVAQVALTAKASQKALTDLQKDTQRYVNMATNRASIVSNLGAIENLGPHTNLGRLFSKAQLHQLGLGHAGSLLGTGLNYWQNIASNSATGALNPHQLSEARRGVLALNRSIRSEERPIEKQLRAYEHEIGHLRGKARVTAEQNMQQLASNLLSLEQTVQSNNSSLQQLTQATKANTSATKANTSSKYASQTGTVAFTYQGQQYLASATGMNLGVGG